MIEKLAAMMAECLYRQGIIPEENRELYQYGLFILFSKGVFLLITILVGVTFHMLRESVLFLLLFSLLRSYAGGVHASKESICSVATIGAIIVAVCSIKIMAIQSCVMFAACLIVVGAVIVFLLCPAATEEKPLSDDDYSYYGRISRVITILYVVTGMMSVVVKVYSILYVIAVVTSLEAILLIGSKVKEGKKQGKGCEGY